MSSLIGLDDNTPHDMTEDELYEYIRYLLDLHRHPHDKSKVPGSNVLLDVEPADLDRLCACMWVPTAISSSARRKVADSLSAGAVQLRTPTPDCSDEDLDEWVRDAYSHCTSTEIVRECIQILVKDVASRGERDVPRELLRITCPDISDVMSGRPVMINVLPWRLATAQDMVQRAAKIKAYLDKLDGI